MLRLAMNELIRSRDELIKANERIYEERIEKEVLKQKLVHAEEIMELRIQLARRSDDAAPANKVARTKEIANQPANDRSAKLMKLSSKDNVFVKLISSSWSDGQVGVHAFRDLPDDQCEVVLEPISQFPVLKAGLSEGIVEVCLYRVLPYFWMTN